MINVSDLDGGELITPGPLSLNEGTWRLTAELLQLIAAAGEAYDAAIEGGPGHGSITQIKHTRRRLLFLCRQAGLAAPMISNAVSQKTQASA